MGHITDEYIFEMINPDSLIYIDSIFQYSLRSPNGTLNFLFYKKDYRLLIWEVKSIYFTNLDNVFYLKPALLDKILIDKGEIFFPNQNGEITIRSEYTFINGIKIKTDQNSKIDTFFENSNYNGFIGQLNDVLIENLDGEQVILFRFKEDINVIFLCYESNDRFYFIIVDSKHTLTTEFLNIFNLHWKSDN